MPSQKLTLAADIPQHKVTITFLFAECLHDASITDVQM